MPSEIGTPKHPLFLFHRTYWLPNAPASSTLSVESNARKHSPLVAGDAFLPVPAEFRPEAALPSSNVEPIHASEREKVQVCAISASSVVKYLANQSVALILS